MKYLPGTALLISFISVPTTFILPIKAQSQAELLTAVPEAPAFTFLSVSPSQIERPGALRDFGAGLLTGVGQDGKMRQGFALDASTWTLIPGLSVPLSKYQQNLLWYMLANTQVSMGTVRVADDSADTEAAFGIRTTLLDHTDPMKSTEFSKSLGDALLLCSPAQPEEEPGNAEDQANVACVDSIVSRSFDVWSQEHWNKARLSLAIAFGRRFVGSSFDHSEYSGFDGWAVGALPVSDSGQLLGQLRYRDRPSVDNAPAYIAWNAGARLLMGSATINGFLEYLRESRSQEEGASIANAGLEDQVESWSAGIEFRVAEGTWISTGLGSRYMALEEPDDVVVFGNLRWGITSTARIASLTAHMRQ